MVDLSTVRAVPGDWIGVRGDDVLVVLGPESARSAARVWIALDEGAGFEAALDVLVRGGLAEADSFVLVETSSVAGARVLVRGRAVVEVTSREGAESRLEAGSLTWREERFEDVAALRLVCGDGDGAADDGQDEPFGAGLRRVGGFRVGRYEAPVAMPVPAEAIFVEPEPEPVDERLAATPVVLVAHAAPEELPEEPADAPELEAEPEAPEGEASEEPPTGEFDDLETAPLVASPVIVPAPTPVPEFPAEAEGWQDEVTSHIPPVSAPAEVPGVPAPATPVVTTPVPGDHADLATGITEVLGVKTPPSATKVEATRPEPAGRATFSHGLVVDVDRPYVIGRAPSLRPDQTDARPVTVPSPLGEISATHVEIRPGTGAETGRLVVVDLGSTNGTLVLRSGQTPLELLPGVPFVLSGEAVVDLGDGATVRLRSS